MSATRRTHRIANSIDSIRGKYEDRIKTDLLPAVDIKGIPSGLTSPISSRSSGLTSEPEELSPRLPSSPNPIPRYRLWDRPVPQATPSSSNPPTERSLPSLPTTTPGPSKRHTLPTFIAPPPEPPRPSSLRSPSPTRLTSPSVTSLDRPSSSITPRNPQSRVRRTSQDIAPAPGIVKRLGGHGSPWSDAIPSRERTLSSPAKPRRPNSTEVLEPSLTGSSNESTESSTTHSVAITPGSSYRSPSPASTHMPQTPNSYRSSYMASKRGAYPDTLGAGGGRRKFGRHLPRIASGDGNEDWEEEKRREEEREEQEARARIAAREKAREQLEGLRIEKAPKPLPSIPQSPFEASEQSDVQGIPGRLRFVKNRVTPKTTASKYTIGLWIDVQRHLLQAYEYLCHVGEAQQWIEGCLQEELPFGVVEMDEGLRNGVVLAKLARVWEGEALVKRIFEHPKLQYKHSDNINYFFVFVRRQGLPESFIFELTDLYNKKNIPKVIYCIHALSHLLARRGMAQRIGNLLGQLQFSDDQLKQTQKGLTGVAMPNFKGIGRDLAKDMNMEPEPEPEPEETEFERRGRLLMESEPDVIKLQAVARGFLARQTLATRRAQLRLAERYIVKLQSRCRGTLTRQFIHEQRKEQMDLIPWVLALQAFGRGVLTRRAWRARIARIHHATRYLVKIQAQARGVIVRRRFARLKTALRSTRVSVVKLQALARAKIGRKVHQEVAKSLGVPIIMSSVVNFQAVARAALKRREIKKSLGVLWDIEPTIADLQAYARGVIVRRRVRAQLAKLDDVSDIVVRIQAGCRSYLAKQRLLGLIRGLRKATPGLVCLQAQARAVLARRKCQQVEKMLSTVVVTSGVSKLQSLARAAIVRRRVDEQFKKLDFALPDIVGIQAVARGVLVRDAFWAWREYLHSSHAEAVHLQALMRGVIQRRKFKQKMAYYKSNLDKVIKIQSLFRAKEQREQYRQLTMGTNVTVGTIKNFVHLLDDSEADFEDEIEVERLRKKVVEGIRENQGLETDVSELDVKIALLVNNVKSFEDLIKTRKRHGADSAAAHAARASVLAAHGDPFASSHTLDSAAKRKLELYQQLFYLLQTNGEYLARLFYQLSR
ncbi:hypothetical protein FRB99_002897, partial [Tulasnella sp. 403]